MTVATLAQYHANLSARVWSAFDASHLNSVSSFVCEGYLSLCICLSALKDYLPLGNSNDTTGLHGYDSLFLFS